MAFRAGLVVVHCETKNTGALIYVSKSHRSETHSDCHIERDIGKVRVSFALDCHKNFIKLSSSVIFGWT